MAENSQGFLSNGPAGRDEERSPTPWIVAGAAVAVVVVVLIVASLRPAKPPANTPDAYAAQLSVSGLQLSQSSNGVGSQITYVDGEVANHGDRTVIGVTVKTTFSDGLNQPGQQETTRLSLIRTREPYVDIEPVSADPIKPGEAKPFRLIFDRVSQDWNQQPPAIQVLQVQTR